MVVLYRNEPSWISKAKILPLRLYVDQDAVDFLKKFFSFKDPHEVSVETSKSSPEAFIRE